VSRSTVTTKHAWDFLKAQFQAELLRVTDVTDPRSNKIAQSARIFTDSSTDSFAAKERKGRKDFTLCASISLLRIGWGEGGHRPNEVTQESGERAGVRCRKSLEPLMNADER